VEGLILGVWAQFTDLIILPLSQFWGGLGDEGRKVFFALVGGALISGLLIGRRFTASGLGGFQNLGEVIVSGVLGDVFSAPDYHLMNHVTLKLGTGTTQIDHILVSRFGVFVIETKHYQGWIFGDAVGRTWTQVLFNDRFRFQNPIRQNLRHVHAVQDFLDFLPADAVKSIVVFTGSAEFKTALPPGVFTIESMKTYIEQHREEVISLNRMQFCVGRLETERLSISRTTDVEHAESLARWHKR
tara:strand:- start:84 stop:812 length:729 start_codon:yes stop_codon:yes gene_type:complete